MNAGVDEDENDLKRVDEGRSGNISDTNKEDHDALLHSLFLRSLPLSFTNPTDNISFTIPIRMSIMGPMQSGKTSLLMDLAYSIIQSSIATHSSHNDYGKDCNGSSSNSKVLFIVPDKKRQLLDFPLHCRPLYDSPNDGDQRVALAGDRHGHEFDQRQIECEQFRQSMESLNAQKQRHGLYSSNPHGNINTGTSQHHDDHHAGQNWTEGDARVLDQIDIRYVKNVTDLVHLLSMVQKKYKHNLAAIIVDGLDHFIRDEFHACHGGLDGQGQYLPANTIEIMKLVQLLALMADTANHMEESLRTSIPENRKQHRVHVITSMNADRLPLGTSSSQSKTIHSLMQNYTPTIASIDKMNQQSFENDSEHINLNRFFGRSVVCKKEDHNAILMECQSAWKIQLQTMHVDSFGTVPIVENGHKGKDTVSCIARAKFCIGRDVNRKNSLQYHDDEEERELFWAMNS